MPLRNASALRRRFAAAADDPFVLIRLVVSGLLFLATGVAIGLSLAGIAPRAWLLLGAIWAVYGVMHGLFDWVMEPLVGFLARGVGDIGVARIGGGFAAIEARAARGDAAGAAEGYLRRAAVPADRVAAMVRRAALLAGPLDRPGDAAAELDALRRTGGDLAPADDIAVGLALADLYEHRLGNPGRAMTELRRLIDRHPQVHHARRMRAMLATLREHHFGDPIAQEPGT